MIFDLTKGYVPESYSKSRDYRVFLRLAGIVLTVLKYNIDNIDSLYDANTCPRNLLPFLGDMVGYEYDESKLESAQRKIISTFPYLIRNRGTEKAIEVATALSASTLQYGGKDVPLNEIYVDYNMSDGTIKISHPIDADLDLNLINVVRPVGTRLVLRPSVSRDILDGEIAVAVEATGSVHEYTDDMGKVGNEVQFGTVDLRKEADSNEE